jgi:acyl-CoA synthetase (AMP-forming)/AMP-acid ligase II
VLADVLRGGVALRADETAVFLHAANRVANALVSLGVLPGDRVAGVMRAGATLVPTNVMYTAEEMQHIVSDSGAKVLFVRSDFAPKIAGIRGALPALAHVVEVCGKSTDSVLEWSGTWAPVGSASARDGLKPVTAMRNFICISGAGILKWAS